MGKLLTGEHLQKRRQALGMSREKLAVMLDASFMTIYRVEVGKPGLGVYPIAMDLMLDKLEAERKSKRRRSRK